MIVGEFLHFLILGDGAWSVDAGPIGDNYDKTYYKFESKVKIFNSDNGDEFISAFLKTIRRV